MMNLTKSVSALAALGLALTACSNNSTPRLTPQPTAPAATTFTQIERLSRPAIKEVFEPFQDHQISNAVEPYNDPTIKSAIQVTEDALRPPKGALDYGATLASVLYPDEYLVNLAGSSTPPALDNQFFLSAEVAPGSFGGRAPNDDVIDLELGVLFGKTLSALNIIADDGEANDCLSSQNTPSEDPAKKTTSTFPYLAAAR
jgi:hypothetical protein